MRCWCNIALVFAEGEETLFPIVAHGGILMEDWDGCETIEKYAPLF
jgi:hypothetical protein